MLEKLAIFYKREVESTVTSLTKAMEPAVRFCGGWNRWHHCDCAIPTNV